MFLIAKVLENLCCKDQGKAENFEGQFTSVPLNKALGTQAHVHRTLC